VLETGRFTWRLVSTDVFLRPGQIECFQEILKLTRFDHKVNYMEVPYTRQSVERLFVNIESDFQVYNTAAEICYFLSKNVYDF
jgi:hypothetical protein